MQKYAGGSKLSASTENGGNRANLAMDGNMGTRWESVHGSDKEWLLITLDELVTVYRLRIFWEAASAREYRVLISETGDEGSFKEVFHGAYSSGARTDDVVPNSPMRAKYIRIEGISRTTQYGYSIFETEIYTV